MRRSRVCRPCPRPGNAADARPPDPFLSIPLNGANTTIRRAGGVPQLASSVARDRPIVASSAGSRPRLGAVIRRVGLAVLIACGIPFAIFYTTVLVAGVWAAIFAALGFAYGAIAWRWLTGRRPSGLLILTATVMTGRTVIAMVANSTFLYFLQPVISDGIVATTFLLSLATTRPMVARLAGDFYPMDHELSLRPAIRRLFRRLTVLWAVLCFAKATLTLWLLETQTLHTFVLVKGISVLTLTTLTIAATIGAAEVVGRKEGLLAPT